MKIRTIWPLVGIGAVLVILVFIVSAVIQMRADRTSGNKPKVLTTFTVLADMTRAVAGDKADVESITKPGAEIHGYEPTPGDIVRMQKADIVLDNGFNLEKWADKLYQNAPAIPHVTLTEGVMPAPIAEGPYKDKPNPHAWMSPSNALVYTDNIVRALIKIDSANETVYKQNGEAYKQQIRAIDATLREGLAKLPENNRYLVSCEGAFTYLIRDYGLKELYLWPINADAQGTPQQIKSVVEGVKANAIPAVFCESTVSSKSQEQVANETGAKYSGVFYVDSLSDEAGPTPTYLKLLEYNMSTLLKGFGVE